VSSHFQQSNDLLAKQLESATLDHEAFQTLLTPCDLQTCRATCCHDGVQLSADDAQLIKILVKQHQQWFTKEGTDVSDDLVQQTTQANRWKTRALAAPSELLAKDFPTHFPKTRCAFLDTEHRCNLQKLSVNQSLPAWHYKPHTCWIHPILIQKTADNYLITLATAKNDPQKTPDYPGFASCAHCGRSQTLEGKPAYQVLKNELTALGKIANRNFYEQLASPTVDWVIER